MAPIKHGTHAGAATDVRDAGSARFSSSAGRAYGRLSPSRVPRPRSSFLLSAQNAIETLAVCAPTIVEAARGQLSVDACNRRLDRWCARVLDNLEVDLHVRGREHLASGRTYVVMSNHQSHYDIAVLYRVLGSNVRMVAKKELFEVPVFGRAMREAGFVSVDRGNTESAIRSLAFAKAHIAAGTHLWIAPEGTRSPTGELLPFKKGGFHVALDMGAPILPVTIRGTRAILPAHGLASRRGMTVHVDLHAPIDPATLEATDRRKARDELMDRVRTAIASTLHDAPEASPQ